MKTIKAIVGNVKPIADRTYTDRNTGNKVNSKVTNLVAYVNGMPINEKYDTVYLDFGLWDGKAVMGQKLTKGDNIAVSANSFVTEEIELLDEFTGEITKHLKVKPKTAATIEVLSGTKYVALSDYKVTAEAAHGIKA